MNEACARMAARAENWAGLDLLNSRTQRRRLGRPLVIRFRRPSRLPLFRRRKPTTDSKLPGQLSVSRPRGTLHSQFRLK